MSGISTMKDFARQLNYLDSFELLEELGINLDTCYSYDEVAKELGKLITVHGGYASEHVDTLYDNLEQLWNDLSDSARFFEDLVLGRIQFCVVDFFKSDCSDKVYIIDEDTREVLRFLEAIKRNQAALEKSFGHR